MLKKLLIIALIFSVFSCKSKSSQKENETVLSEQNEKLRQEQQQAYQTLADEQQAALLDKQAQEAAAAKAEEVEVQDRVFFSYDSTDLSDESKKILTTQAEWLKSDPSIKVIVEGHCDERGTNEYNMALGDRRANAAKAFLVKMGVSRSRIDTISYGEERPQEPGHDESAWSRNRRAAFILLSK